MVNPLSSQLVLNTKTPEENLRRLTSTVIKESDTKYRLTGINMMDEHPENPCYAPNNPKLARIGGRKRARYDNHTFTQFYPASLGRQPSKYKGKLIGYTVHAHCWVLLGRVEGLKLNEAKLAKLVQVCRKYWNNGKSWEIYGIKLSPIEPRQVPSCLNTAMISIRVH